jgi:hypothetical protein
MEDWMFEKLITFTPAYDKRHPDPSKNYGIHGVSIKFVLIGSEGATQFVLYTNWQLPHVTKEHLDKQLGVELFFMPMPADLGYHSKVPHYEGQEPIEQNCEYTKGPCYYDGSGLAAERVYKVLLEKGDEGVWGELEKYYYDIFSQGDEK